MNYDAILAVGLDRIPAVREFDELFPNAEHTVVKAKRDFSPNGWQIVYEWISRSHLYDRYVLWLVVAIDIGADGSLAELEKPDVCVIEIDKIERSRNDNNGPKWEFNIVEFEDGAWAHLVENRGNFDSIDLDLITNRPVDRFTTFWHDTRPPRLAEPPEGMAFKAHLRFSMP